MSAPAGHMHTVPSTTTAHIRRQAGQDAVSPLFTHIRRTPILPSLCNSHQSGRLWLESTAPQAPTTVSKC